jgi:hypothetical protein
MSVSDIEVVSTYDARHADDSHSKNARVRERNREREGDKVRTRRGDREGEKIEDDTHRVFRKHRYNTNQVPISKNTHRRSGRATKPTTVTSPNDDEEFEAGNEDEVQSEMTQRELETLSTERRDKKLARQQERRNKRKATSDAKGALAAETVKADAAAAAAALALPKPIILPPSESDPLLKLLSEKKTSVAGPNLIMAVMTSLANHNASMARIEQTNLENRARIEQTNLENRIARMEREQATVSLTAGLMAALVAKFPI